MKLAEVEYTGWVRQQQHMGLSGEVYRFTGDKTVDVFEIGDARQFERKPNFEVNWTAMGRLAQMVADESGDVRDAIEDMKYSVKQEIAKRFDGIRGNASQTELDEALEEKAERLREQMETRV